MEEENLTDIVIPKASYMQTGTRNIIRIIQEKIPSISEGDFLDLSDEITQSTPKFLDLFWFFDPTLKKKDVSKNEIPLDLVTLSINLNYGNLRVNGYKDAENALHNQALFITQDLLSVNAAVYPTGVFNIRHLNNGEGYRPIEQLFVKYDPQKEPWHDELTCPYFQKQNDRIRMTLTRGEKNYFYIFKDRQYQLLNYALDYVLSNSLSIVGFRK